MKTLQGALVVSVAPRAILAGAAFFIASALPAFAQVKHDTAGVVLVQNPPAAGMRLRWTVDPEPVVEIGGAVDDPRYQLFHVVDAARLSDGRIAVANGGSYELRYYNGRGIYISAVGGEGEGPGEFRLISGFEVTKEDTIFVFDRQLQRLSVFNARGELARDLRIPLSIAPLSSVGRFSDGRWYARDDDELKPGPPGAIRRDTARYISFDPDFQSHSLVTVLPGVMTASFRSGGTVGYRIAPFSPFSAHDVFGTCLYIVSGDDFEVRIFSSNGRLVRIVRNDGQRHRVSHTQRTAWIDGLIHSQIPEAARSQIRQVMARIPTPDYLPVYNDVVVDAYGYVWLQEYVPQTGSSQWWSGSSQWWIVLGPTGELQGRVETPVALEIFDIGTDYVLGLWRDEVGEEFVRMYQLRADRDPQLRSLAECAESHENHLQPSP